MPQEEQVKDETESFNVSTSDAPKVEVQEEEPAEKEVVANTDEDAAESIEEETGTEEVKEEKPKKKSRAQKRIENLNAEKNKAYDRIAELEAKLKENSETTEEVDPADFDSYEEYEAAIEKEMKPKEVEVPKTVLNKDFVQARDELFSKFDEDADKYSDFDEKLNNQDLKISDHMVMAFNELDNATDTVYYFTNHPEEAAKVAKMTAAKQAVYVVNKSAELKKAPKKKLTKAPDPIETVGGGGEYEKPINELSFSDFEAKRNAETGTKKFW